MYKLQILNVRRFNSRFDKTIQSKMESKTDDIFKKGKRSPLLGFSKNKKKGTHVGAIKFYGWTKEVAEDEMTLVRECTGLSVKEGFDDRAVYIEAPLLSALINNYSGVLKHVAGK
jgi:hypothetical protein